MIVWINGPFGVGKTTLATGLEARMPGRVFDPEKVGFLLRSIIKEPIDDFQHWPCRGVEQKLILLHADRRVIEDRARRDEVEHGAIPGGTLTRRVDGGLAVVNTAGSRSSESWHLAFDQ